MKGTDAESVPFLRGGAGGADSEKRRPAYCISSGMMSSTSTLTA